MEETRGYVWAPFAVHAVGGREPNSAGHRKWVLSAEVISAPNVVNTRAT